MSKRSSSETPHGTSGARLFTSHQASPTADLEGSLRFYDGIQVFAEVKAPRQRNILSVHVKFDLIHAFPRNVGRLASMRYSHYRICVAMDLDAGSECQGDQRNLAAFRCCNDDVRNVMRAGFTNKLLLTEGCKWVTSTPCILCVTAAGTSFLSVHC